jgi:hypothetical protein
VLVIGNGHDPRDDRICIMPANESDGNGAAGVSIYDYLIADEKSKKGSRLTKRWRRILARIVRRDSMYEFS